jgi:hypothetical protein
MSVKTVVVAPPLQPFRWRRHKARPILIAHVKPNHDETVHVAIRQRTNQYRVEGTEHRRNPYRAPVLRLRRLRTPGSGGSGAIRNRHRVRVAPIASSPGRAGVLLHQREIAQLTACCLWGLVLRQSVFLTLPLLPPSGTEVPRAALLPSSERCASDHSLRKKEFIGPPD